MGYIVGDWVEVNNKKGRVIAAYLDGNSHIYYVINDGEDNDEYLTNEIQGIPLTPEILETNKWEKFKSKRITWWRTQFGNTYFYARQQNPAIWFICRGKSRHVLKKIKYVHQLQHLLFGLGLDNNLKI